MREESDYRESHLNKGADYDCNLSGSGFDGYMAAREQEILSVVVSHWLPNKIPRYLDFACGTGRITQFFERIATESYGVDVSETMLEQARRKCTKTTFIRQDITRERLQIAPVDVVSAFRFLGNAQDDLRIAAVRTMRGHLTEGGFLIVNNHRNTSTMQGALKRVLGKKALDGLRHSRLVSLLADNGFRILRMYGVGFWIIRDKFVQPQILNSRFGRILEPISRIPVFAPYSPDYVIVAQKTPG
jgi:SAM-dependent methyltransferase